MTESSRRDKVSIKLTVPRISGALGSVQKVIEDRGESYSKIAGTDALVIETKNPNFEGALAQVLPSKSRGYFFLNF
jgi:hypothetical protein